jgi:ubiquinone/menaquinone biosynthesis C-methylase UbiE
MADIDTDFKKDMLLELIEKELVCAETVLDFGCGKLAFLKNMAENFPAVQRLIGVDPKSQPEVEDLDPRIIFERDLSSVAEASVDLAVIKLVLHHIENDVEIIEILRNIKKTLKPGGKLIIFEESFRENEMDITEIKEYLSQFNLKLAEDATANFLKLSKEEKQQYLFLNDWLMNLQNKYMPWAWQYKSMEEWTKLVETAGFKNLKNNFIGAIKRRKRKQGMTVILKFAI